MGLFGRLGDIEQLAFPCGQATVWSRSNFEIKFLLAGALGVLGAIAFPQKGKVLISLYSLEYVFFREWYTVYFEILFLFLLFLLIILVYADFQLTQLTTKLREFVLKYLLLNFLAGSVLFSPERITPCFCIEIMGNTLRGRSSM